MLLLMEVVVPNAKKLYKVFSTVVSVCLWMYLLLALLLELFLNDSIPIVIVCFVYECQHIE